MYLHDLKHNAEYEKPRGYFRETHDDKFNYKDTSKVHFEGTWNRIIWPAVKICVLIAIYIVSSNFFALSKMYSFLICILAIIGYPHVVAAVIPNTIVMPAMDH